jgi:hypothetical protein
MFSPMPHHSGVGSHRMTMDEARRIAANIAKLPELLQRQSAKTNCPGRGIGTAARLARLRTGLQQPAQERISALLIFVASLTAHTEEDSMPRGDKNKKPEIPPIGPLKVTCIPESRKLLKELLSEQEMELTISTLKSLGDHAAARVGMPA